MMNNAKDKPVNKCWCHILIQVCLIPTAVGWISKKWKYITMRIVIKNESEIS